jgi:hippurate hydrolase
MKIRNSIQNLAEEISACRRSLHENPQTAFEEEFASALVAEKLGEWGITFEKGLGKTGIVATIKGERSDSGRSIGLRADMDALDIEDKSGQPWASKIPGKMHGCGHDGHTAMLLGAAKYLSENRSFNGAVHLIFQPAEEGERGAEAMMEDGLFEKFPCDAVYGMHNWPYLPKGKIATRPGPVMASSDSFALTVKGKGGHAAMPHKTADPLAIGAQIVTALQNLVSRRVDPVDTAVVSVTNFNCGTGADNVIADSAEITGTVRAFSPDTRDLLQESIENIARGIARPHGAEIDYNYRRVIDPTINDPQQTGFCAEVARGLAGEENVDTDFPRCMGGEDFGAMLARVKGCYVIIGQGEPDNPDSPHNNGLHTAFYDFNDDIIPIGIEYWARVVEAALPMEET